MTKEEESRFDKNQNKAQNKLSRTHESNKIILSASYRLSLGEQLGFLKQEPGFATKAIHTGQAPDQWESR